MLVPILFADDWDMCKDIVLPSQVQLLEVAVERIIVAEDLPNNLNVVNGNTTELESTIHLSQGPPMEEPPSEEFVGVSVNNDSLLLVDLSHVHVPSP